MSVEQIRGLGRRELGSIRVAIPHYTEYIVSSAMDRWKRRGALAVPDGVLNGAQFQALIEFGAGLPYHLRNAWRQRANLIIAEDLLAGGNGSGAVMELTDMMPKMATLAVSLEERPSEQLAFAQAWQRDQRVLRIDGLPPGWGLPAGDIGAYDSAVAAQWVQAAQQPPPMLGPPVEAPITSIPPQMLGGPTTMPVPQNEIQPTAGGDGAMRQNYTTLPTYGKLIDGEPMDSGGFVAQQNNLGDIVRGALPVIGGIVGGALGGPGGAALGGAIGGALGGNPGGGNDLPPGFPTPGGITPTIGGVGTGMPPGGNFGAGNAAAQAEVSAFQKALNAAGWALDAFVSSPINWPAQLKELYRLYKSNQLPLGPGASGGASTEPVYPGQWGGPGTAGTTPGLVVYNPEFGQLYRQPYMEVTMEQRPARAPKGYVTVTYQGRKVYMLKSEAKRLKLWKPATKPTMTGADKNAIKRAKRALKDAEKIHDDAVEIARIGAKLDHKKVVDKGAEIKRKPKRKGR